jgi:hypothetical protein
MPAGGAATSTSTTTTTSTALAALAALGVSVVSAVSVALAVLAAQAVLGAQAELVALAALGSLVVWAAQAALAGLVVLSRRGVGARGLTTLRIEAVPPTATSGPPTNSVVKPGDNRHSGAPALATGALVAVRVRAEPVQATGLRPAARDSGAVPAGATGFPMPVAVAAAIR